ncbi:MAG: hypothetical protein KA764_15250 [Anaerolineales bacterium]|nr:hypothetical protein [Anaerolineales bacterium]
MNLGLSAKRLTLALTLSVILLTGLSLAGNLARLTLGLPRMEALNLNRLALLLDVDQEANLPTWYSTMTLFIASSLLSLIGLIHRIRRERLAAHWLGLALIVSVLSFDELAGLHEWLNSLLKRFGRFEGPWFYPWVIVGGVVTLLFVGIYMRFFLQLPPRLQPQFALAAGLYIGGALGLEIVGGLIMSQGAGSALYFILETTTEELLEMVGVLLLIRALIQYLTAMRPSVHIGFEA